MFYLLSSLRIVSLFIFRKLAMFVIIISLRCFLLVSTFHVPLIINYSLPLAYPGVLAVLVWPRLPRSLAHFAAVFPCLILVDFQASFTSSLLPFTSPFSSVAQACPTFCDPRNRSTPGLPVHHQLQDFTQTCVHQVRDAIQPSHPLSSPSPPAPNPSQHQSLFQ